MSHFISIVDTVRCQLFYFGKSVGRSHAVFQEVVAAASLDDFYLMLSAFPTEEEGWGADPRGVRRLFEWMRGQPSSNFMFWCDACDAPMYSGSTRWWPYRGSIYSDEEADIFGYLGYLHFADGDPLYAIAKCRGALSRLHLADVVERFRRTGYIERYQIPGLDFTLYLKA